MQAASWSYQAVYVCCTFIDGIWFGRVYTFIATWPDSCCPVDQNVSPSWLLRRPPYALIITTFLRPRKGEVRTYLVCRESCAATTKTNRQNVVDFQCAKRRFANCQSATCWEPFRAGAVFPDTPPTNSHPSDRATQCEQCGQLVITGWPPALPPRISISACNCRAKCERPGYR